jgi:hypothetical protein
MGTKRGWLGVFCGALAAGTLGCATYTSLDYARTDVASAPGSGLISVAQFRDLRAKHPHVLGAVRDPMGIPVYTLKTDEPVRRVVTRAFEQALHRRGLQAQERPRFILTGDIDRLDSNGYGRLSAHADVEVELLDSRTGRLLYQQNYRSRRASGFTFGLPGARDEARELARVVLRDVIDQALEDPRLLAVLRAD